MNQEDLQTSKQPVPAPPASYWRERFTCRAEHFNGDSDAVAMFQALHDGLAALEDEVARLKGGV